MENNNLKCLVVYHSMNGGCEFAAKHIAKRLDAKMLHLDLVKPFNTKGIGKYILGAKQSIFKEKPKLQTHDTDFEMYDLIVLGTPVRAGNISPAFKTFLAGKPFENKNIALYSCSHGKNESLFQKFRTQLGEQNVLGTIEFFPSQKKYKENIETFCGDIDGWLDEVLLNYQKKL